MHRHAVGSGRNVDGKGAVCQRGAIVQLRRALGPGGGPAICIADRQALLVHQHTGDGGVGCQQAEIHARRHPTARHLHELACAAVEVGLVGQRGWLHVPFASRHRQGITAARPGSGAQVARDAFTPGHQRDALHARQVQQAALGVDRAGDQRIARQQGEAAQVKGAVGWHNDRVNRRAEVAGMVRRNEDLIASVRHGQLKRAIQGVNGGLQAGPFWAVQRHRHGKGRRTALRQLDRAIHAGICQDNREILLAGFSVVVMQEIHELGGLGIDPFRWQGITDRVHGQRPQAWPQIEGVAAIHRRQRLGLALAVDALGRDLGMVDQLIRVGRHRAGHHFGRGAEGQRVGVGSLRQGHRQRLRRQQPVIGPGRPGGEDIIPGWQVANRPIAAGAAQIGLEVAVGAGRGDGGQAQGVALFILNDAP